MSEQLILQASLRLFARYGYDYVSVRQIAGEADVNIGSISYYFHNKIGILQRIVDDFYKGLTAAIYPIIDEPGMDKVEAVRKVTHSVIEYMYSNFDSSRIVMREITLETERFDEVMKKYNISFNNRLVEFFERLGLKHPRRATIKFMALTRFPFANVNLVEYYYNQPFSYKLFEDYAETVLSSLSDELMV